LDRWQTGINACPFLVRCERAVDGPLGIPVLRHPPIKGLLVPFLTFDNQAGAGWVDACDLLVGRFQFGVRSDDEPVNQKDKKS